MNNNLLNSKLLPLLGNERTLLQLSVLHSLHVNFTDMPAGRFGILAFVTDAHAFVIEQLLNTWVMATPWRLKAAETVYNVIKSKLDFDSKIIIMIHRTYQANSWCWIASCRSDVVQWNTITCTGAWITFQTIYKAKRICFFI